MINKILPKSNNELLCWRALVSALTSYYYGEDLADENIKKLFNFVRHELKKPLLKMQSLDCVNLIGEMICFN